jgi:carbonic anhydrase
MHWKKTMFVDRRRILLGLALCPACAAGAWAEAHWSYGGDGAPEKWGTLDTEFRACSIGTEQSPIDLKDAVNADLPSMSIAWRPQQNDVGNNGHTIQLDATPGDSLTLDGRVYEFKQFHFHTPSEHAVDGKRLAMEAHFVHAQANGGLAVVGVLMNEGARNAAFSSIMRIAPEKLGSVRANSTIDPNALLPTEKSVFRYAGSLTTPPCSEVVDWIVFAQPVEVDGADITAFKKIFPMNARPLQPINRRVLLRSR